MNISALEAAVLTLIHSLESADQSLIEMDDDPIDIAQLARIRALAAEAKRSLSVLTELLDTALGDACGQYETVIEGIGVIRRHKRKSRTKWDSPDLLRTVLDSRLVDKTTGEVKDESPLDRVLHVWNIGAPRATALKERGIQIDEYCTTETRPGWTIEVV